MLHVVPPQETDSPELDYKYRGLWSPHLKQLMELTREAAKDASQDALVEIMGTLANMSIYDLPASSSWAKLVKEYGLLGLFSRMLVPGMVANDLLLEIVMLIASIASDTQVRLTTCSSAALMQCGYCEHHHNVSQQACTAIASSSLIGLLYQVWQDKREDVEILLQLLHTFHK